MKRLDGGLATTLQRQGLGVYEPVEPWLFAHRGEVLRAQRAFVAAGAEVLLTATFRSLPSERKDWKACVDAAIGIAREAGAGEVWLSLGPGSGHPDVVKHAGKRVDGVVLETFVNVAEAAAAVSKVRRVWSGLLVASLVPPFALETRPLLDAGACGVGFNCAAEGEVLAAVRGVDDGVLVWAKPNGPISQEAWDTLAARCEWLGGCCGTTPEMLR